MRRLLIAVFSVLTLKSFAATAPEPIRHTLGPFEIVHTATMLTQHSPNSWRGTLIGTQVPMWGVTVNWQGQKVIGGGGRVLALTGAQQPALILVGDQANYLVMEDAGKPIRRKFPKDGYRIRTPLAQWLDSDNGQPGEPIQLATNTDQSRESLQFAGGRLLLLNDGVVLDVQTLQSWELDFFANRDSFDGYRADSANEARAFFLSPSRSQIVFVASRPPPTGSEFEHALIVAEVATNRMYIVPFGPAVPKFSYTKDPTPAWLERHFVWGRDGAGRERLQSR